MSFFGEAIVLHRVGTYYLNIICKLLGKGTFTNDVKPFSDIFNVLTPVPPVGIIWGFNATLSYPKYLTP